ncbi:hypothetical protein VF14_32560 [Nostoc linckia z18]|uniref:Uncharacterized protein n=2 Tax=Nostoc linckia TaxID=92942 RepID=A0A9Q5ZCM5_NOSLI|nr:hypothetical protein VF02_36405 [Nostoc linckia z1]PHJ56414.1 hypothetical protein VF05_37245 [Nostoc linckia z3]PHJ57922.1 hypothetical protein VF03_36020 [Nostoc linckia z2]PHJ79523.1 hypothetical protein VF06_25735 [Nostoc linckia z4]PHJ87763.1 hypothetical protein VF04_34330 [Nostoc linckia z7]PHJ88958.1 hypothetical protein VF07_14605 [Nostoc linckia z6]PHK02572.1 hypothetical protein VF09_31500 [Nostoc linckia z9]PHK03993.1 hypothetical protein VF08_13110 [Nostoc linckia z8]PHK1371
MGIGHWALGKGHGALGIWHWAEDAPGAPGTEEQEGKTHLPISPSPLLPCTWSLPRLPHLPNFWPITRLGSYYYKSFNNP